jgi:hypothetical protein
MKAKTPELEADTPSAATPAGRPPAQAATATAGAPGIVDPKLFALDGLYLSGQLVGRQRREFSGKAGAPSRFVITLTVLTRDGVHKPERWCDTPTLSDIPTVGEHVCIPVRIALFTSRGGGTGYRLNWGPESSGQEF